MSQDDEWDREADYQRRYKNTMRLIANGDIEVDDYICECGNISVFGGEGYVNPKTKIFWCGYCDGDKVAWR